jgi:copper chaperone
MDSMKINVAGMHCDGCERSISNAISRLDGVSEVEADFVSGSVVVTGEQLARDAISTAIEDAGYEVVPEGGKQLPVVG